MSNVELKAYKASEISFVNNVEEKVQFNLGNKVSHNVKYTSTDICEATLSVEVCDKSKPQLLSVKVVVKGIFKINREIEKEFIHVETFKELFPYAKALVTTVTANAGIPPVLVKNVDIEKQEIYRWNLGGGVKNE